MGEFAARPDGGLFRVDASAGGKASGMRLESIAHGRLVDVFDTAPDGSERLWFRDFLVGENEQSDGVSRSVRQDPITQRTSLVILRENDPTRSDDEFDAVLRDAASGVRPVFSKGPTELPPYSLVPRNGALMLKFSDALDSGSIRAQTVRLAVGSPPVEPFEARVFADPNHGALVDVAGETVFRSTRILIDLAVDQGEAENLNPPIGANPLGLPPSVAKNVANVLLQVPTTTDFGAGQFSILTNLTGHGLVTGPHDSVDGTDPTRPVQWAMRSGGDDDLNRGYLVDLEPPVIVGEQSVSVTAAVDGEGGGLEFVVDLVFDSVPCALRPRVGHVLASSSGRFRVTTDAEAPIGGLVQGVRLSSLDGVPVDAAALLGTASVLAPFDSVEHLPECFVQFVPRPTQPPTTGLQPNTSIRVRFSEPMEPTSIAALGSWIVSRAASDPKPDDIVVGRITPAADLRSFLWSPSAPMPHQAGVAERFELWVDEDLRPITDLSGNRLRERPGRIGFQLDAASPPVFSGSYALGFGSRDEDGNGDYSPDGTLLSARPEVRGQLIYDLESGVIRPRPVSRFSGLVDGSQPIVGLMGIFPPGLQTPLSPLGSRLMHLFRYIDFGYQLRDETLYNLDVEGLHWASADGTVAADRYERFQVRVGHSNRFPDEYNELGQGIKYWLSGLKGGAWDSTGINTVSDPAGAMVVTHPKELGYDIVSADSWVADTGTRFMPFPMNRDPDPTDDILYTWRDTSILALGGPNGGGVEPGILVNAGTITSNEIGVAYSAGNVPTIALPLLLEYSCYPSDTGLGLNSVRVSIATNALTRPFFRLFSTGGVDTTGSVVLKDPDLQTKPTGGFNPGANGAKTAFGDPVFYWGAVDFVVRVSRVHTIWIDAGAVADWHDVVLEPSAGAQPEGASIALSFRGALDVMEEEEGAASDGSTYDAYGNPRPLAGWGGPAGPVEYLVDEGAWTESLEDLAGARFIQVRATFISNIISGAAPELSGLGVSFSTQ